MTTGEFRESAKSGMAPEGASPALLALWHDARGDWEKAHESAQAEEGGDGAWVHAYLHRKEGDVSNAGYWYSRAGRRPASGDLGAEWEAIAAELLSGRR